MGECTCCGQARSFGWPCGCKTVILGGRPHLDTCRCCGNCKKHCTRNADVGPRASGGDGIAKLEKAIRARDARAFTFTIGEIMRRQ